MDFTDWKDKSHTNDGRLNFVGGTILTFDIINAEWEPSTREAYLSDYINRVFPLADKNLAITDYETEDVEALLAGIRKENGVLDVTIDSRYRHLIVDPIEETCRHFRIPSLLLPDDTGREVLRHKADAPAAPGLLPKSLNDEEQERLKTVLNDPECDGKLVGIALMAFTGMRNNEACGLNFEDILELPDYPGIYWLRIVKTTKINSNKLKLGGKTYNAIRRLVMIPELYKFLEARRRWVSRQAVFPMTDSYGTVYNSVSELPIVCRGANFCERADSYDLSEKGKEFLTQTVRIPADILGFGIEESKTMKEECEGTDEEELIESEPTTYLLRRNWATRIFALGFTEVERNYYMGHALNSVSISRMDFTDDVLIYAMYKKLL